MTKTKKKSFRCVVVGIGGSGSWLVEGLARMLQFSAPGSALVMIDADTYEPKNVERQSFKGYGNKAFTKAVELAPQFEKIFISPVASWVVDAFPEDYDEGSDELVVASDFLVEGDIVFAMVDNFAARKVLFDAATKFDNIDVYTGGNDEAYYGTIYHYCRRDGVEVTELPYDWHPELANPADRNPGLLSCQEKAELEGGTQLIATNMAVAAWLLARFKINILDGVIDTEAEINFDLGAGVATPSNRQPEEATELVSSGAIEAH